MIRIYLTIIFSALSFVGLHASTVEKTAEMSSFYYLSGFVGGDINIYYQAPLSSATNYPIISNNRIGINYTNANTFVLSANNGAIITNIVMTVTQTTSASYAVDGSSTYKSLTLSTNTYTASTLSAKTVTFKCTAS